MTDVDHPWALDDILDSAHEAFISMDDRGLITAWNAQAERTFGWSRDEALGRSLGETIIPRRLRAAHARGLRQAVSSGELSLTDRRVDMRALHRDGHEIPVEMTISVTKVDGRAAFHGFVRDVTDRRRAEEASRRLAAIIESTDDGVMSATIDGILTSWNGGAQRLFGWAAHEVVGRRLSFLIPPEREGEELWVLEKVAAGRGIESFETRRTRRDGSRIDVSITYSGIRAPNGSIVGVSAIVREIANAANAAATDKLATDALTGVLDERELQRRLDREVASFEEIHEPFTVLLVEVGADSDERARQRALRAVAGALTGACRADDPIYRNGADGFAVLLAGPSGATSQRVKSRAERAMNALELDVGVVFALVEWPHDGPHRVRFLASARNGRGDARAVLAAAPEDSSEPGVAIKRRALEVDLVERVLATVREELGMDVSYLAELDGDQQVLRAIDGDAASFGASVGDALALGETYCQRMLDGELPGIVADAPADPRVNDLAMTREAGIGAYIGVPVQLSDGHVYGTLCALCHAPRDDLDMSALRVLRLSARLVAARLEHERERHMHDQHNGEIASVRALLAALVARDGYAGDHSEKVVSLASDVARSLCLDEREIDEVEQLALLHDIGKIGIPDSILRKDGPLSGTEWEIMREHSEIGTQIVAGLPSLAHLAPLIRSEHERWDGRGYPQGLAGDQVPLPSRIVLACDAYHSMTSGRPYRRALSVPEALRELERNAGSQFDPSVVACLLRVLERKRRGAPVLANRRTAESRWRAFIA